LILSQWKSALAYLPMETVTRNQQSEYYAALSAADRASDATGFVEFMLHALLATRCGKWF
jgi:Fic family protein